MGFFWVAEYEFLVQIQYFETDEVKFEKPV